MTVDDKDERQNADSDVEPSENIEIDKATTKLDDPPTRGQRGAPRWLRSLKLVPVILVLLLVVSTGLAAWLYFDQYRPDQQIDAGVAHAAVSAASEGTVALLSYAPETLDQDFATAKSHLGGDFLSYYDEFTQQIVAPAAKQKSLKTTAHVMHAAVAELHPNSAVVLVFVDQNTTSKDKPDPSMAASSVLVTLAKVNGKWLITKFDPV